LLPPSRQSHNAQLSFELAMHNTLSNQCGLGIFFNAIASLHKLQSSRSFDARREAL